MALSGQVHAAQHKPSRAEIFAARFPQLQPPVRGLAETIVDSFPGQYESADRMQKEFGAYLKRPEATVRQPPFLVLAGFKGGGKSELIDVVGRHLNLPVVRVSLQTFSSDSAVTVGNFAQMLLRAVKDALEKSSTKDGRYLLHFDDLEKISEIAPDGASLNRPILGLIRGLLNQGRIAVPPTGETLDIRGAFSILTLNFRDQSFGFRPDPRLTSVDEVLWEGTRLASDPRELKARLNEMFSPETVALLMPKVQIFKPLDDSEYLYLVEREVSTVGRERFHDPNTGQNKARIHLKITAAYKRHLYRETVVPSEGPGHAVMVVRQLVNRDLDGVLDSIAHNSALNAVPLNITLDFQAAASQVVGYASKKGPKHRRKEIYRQQIDSKFPALKARGRMSHERLSTAVHEFGHAFIAVRLGKRIDAATVVSAEEGISGMVTFKDGSNSAHETLMQIYANLASQAMERIFFSKKPLEPGSVLDISAGAGIDIQQATRLLWSFLFELGLNPNSKGGTISHSPAGGEVSDKVDFSSVPHEKTEALSLILRDMQNFVVSDLLKVHGQRWYKNKIARFARAGALDEEQFYKLLNYPYPGDNEFEVSEKSRLYQIFKGEIEPLPTDLTEAAKFKQGGTQTTARENFEAYTKAFESFVDNRLYSRPVFAKCERLLKED